MNVRFMLAGGALVLGLVVVTLLLTQGRSGEGPVRTRENPGRVALGSLNGASAEEVRARLGAPDDIVRLENAEPAEFWTYPIVSKGESECTNLVVRWSRQHRVIGAERQTHPCASVSGATG